MRNAISWPPVIRGLGAPWGRAHAGVPRLGTPDLAAGLPQIHARDSSVALFEVALQCEFKVARLAARLGVSQWWLQRFFKSKFQASPGAWLREQRLLLARRMLADAATVKQVAYALQFRSPSQFCRDFKARFGHSPSAALHDAIKSERTDGHALLAARQQPAQRAADAD